MRYIGNKEKILQEIEDVIIDNKLDEKCESFFDAFSRNCHCGRTF